MKRLVVEFGVVLGKSCVVVILFSVDVEVKIKFGDVLILKSF